MDSLRDRMQRVVLTRKDEAEANKRKYYDSSKERLYSILEKKLKTSFIGAISEFEEAFGSLWGKGKRESELTENELKFREVWNQVRTNVLNNGNNQIRAVKNELGQYDVTWNSNQYNFNADKESGKLINRPKGE